LEERKKIVKKKKMAQSWEGAQAQGMEEAIAGLSDKERLCMQIQELRAQLDTESRTNEELVRQNKIKEREVAVLKREEKALGLIRLRRDRDKLSTDVIAMRTRLEQEEEKLKKTAKMIVDTEQEMRTLKQRAVEQKELVEQLKRKKFESDRELGALQAQFAADFSAQQARRDKIEEEVAAVGQQLVLDTRVRQKLSSLRGVAEDTLDLMKGLLDREYDYTDQTEDSLQARLNA
jgi:hypothetical protein